MTGQRGVNMANDTGAAMTGPRGVNMANYTGQQ